MNETPDIPKEKLTELPLATDESNNAATPPANSAPSVAPAPVPGAETISASEIPLGEPSGQLAPEPPAQPAPEPKESKSIEDYRKADWTKTNAQLAREFKVSRQRIGQVRDQLFGKKSETPDFSDLTGNGNNGEQPQSKRVEIDNITTPANVVDYSLMAENMFNMGVGTMVLIFGDEWKPLQPQQPGQPGEKEIVCMALKNYFQSKQMQDLPPGLMLTAVLVAYSAPRLRAPNTATKLKFAWTAIKTKLGGFFKRKK